MNRVKQIILSNLYGYINESDVNLYSQDGFWKYTIKIKDYFLEISYDVMDNFYRIKIDNMHNNFLQHTTFLTKSKRFKKDIKKHLKYNNINGQSFENQMLGFADILKKNLDIDGNLSHLEKTYVSDVKFDGIFI
ncbi:MAG: hypothetical protein IKA74_01900 [Clostridia bacterium]|nr:hypothetical protein [Clostridia bacterium]